MADEKRIEIDYAILVCDGCKDERTHSFDPPLIGADQLIEFMNTKVTRCHYCSAATCEVRAHLVGSDSPS